MRRSQSDLVPASTPVQGNASTHLNPSPSKERRTSSNGNKSNLAQRTRQQRLNQRRRRRGGGGRLRNRQQGGSSIVVQFFSYFLMFLGVLVLVDFVYMWGLLGSDISFSSTNHDVMNLPISQSKIPPHDQFSAALQMSNDWPDKGQQQQNDPINSDASESSDAVGDEHPLTYSKTRFTNPNNVGIPKVYVQAASSDESEPLVQDREPVLDILRQGGFNLTYGRDTEIINALPTWATVERIYGKQAKIMGLERCEEFRKSADPVVRFYGISGTFNSGTNLMAELLIQNCQLTERMLVVGNESKGMRWQVPWGKHYPAYRRGTHSTRTDKTIPVEASLPIVVIRDPYSWAQSMCRHKYAANWSHTQFHCPNLVPTMADLDEFPDLSSNELIQVKVRYAKDFHEYHDSLFHMWNDWYQLYMNVTYPRIIVRFEDLLFRAKEVTETVCACGGGVPRDDQPEFQHIGDSAKLGTRAHGSHKTNLLGALMKYGTDKHRLDSMTKKDLEAAEELLDARMMRDFNYFYPQITEDSPTEEELMTPELKAHLNKIKDLTDQAAAHRQKPKPHHPKPEPHPATANFTRRYTEPTPATEDLPDPKDDREPILDILRQGGFNLTYGHDSEIINALPTWSTVERIYGDELKIMGLERCEEFRKSTDPVVKFYGISGTFNSGTNLMAELLIQNCQLTERMLVVGNESKGMRWQVPWGKHYPAYRRGSHATRTDVDVPVESSLPIVVLRDPYSWAQSMCRHKYAANWSHTPHHCPNLVPDGEDLDEFDNLYADELIPVRVRYAKDFREYHDSLFHMWNEWYRLYVDAKYPRIIVRFEDLLFRAKELTEQVCACGGGVPRDDQPEFQHIGESAKLGTRAHGKHKTNLLGAMMKYGTDKHRLDKMTRADLEAAEMVLDPELMATFNYFYPPIPSG